MPVGRFVGDLPYNLLANNSSRSCRFNGARGKDVGQDLSVYLEYINNVNYNWAVSLLLRGRELLAAPRLLRL